MNQFSIQAVSSPFLNTPKFSAKTKVTLVRDGRSFQSLYSYPGVDSIEQLDTVKVSTFRNTLRRVIKALEVKVRPSIPTQKGGLGDFQDLQAKFERIRVDDQQGGIGTFVISGNARKPVKKGKEPVPVSGLLTIDMNRGTAHYTSDSDKVNRTIPLPKPIKEVLAAASAESLGMGRVEELIRQYERASFQQLTADS